MRSAELSKKNEEFVLQFGPTSIKVESPIKTAAPNTTSADKILKNVKVSEDGSQLFVPPVENAKDVLYKALSRYRRDGEPRLVSDGPLSGAARLTYVASLEGKTLDPATEMQAFLEAFRLLENPNSEPIMLVVQLIDAYEVFSGKRPSPLVFYFMTRSKASACCTENSPFVMLATQS